MEPQTRFDLTAALRQWRLELEGNPGALNGADLAELESHLRDSMAPLRSGGLSEEEAFLIARRRLGGGLPLTEEFAKAHPERVWLDRALWMLVGVLGLGLTSSVARLLATGVALAGVYWSADPAAIPALALAVAVTQIALTLGLGFGVWRVVARPGGRRSTAAVTWFAERPAIAAIALMVFQAVSYGLSQGTMLLGARLVGPEGFRSFFESQSLSSLAAALLVPPVALFLVLRSRKPRTEVATVD